MNSRTIVATVFASVVGIALLYFGFNSRPEEPQKIFSASELPAPWKPEVTKAFEELAMSDSDGRVKSFFTFAHYELLRTRAYAGLTVKTGEKEKRSWTPVEWTLDCLFYPEQAKTYPSIIVEDSEIIARLGMTPHAKYQHERYTYNELLPIRDALLKEGQKLSEVPSEQLDRVQRLTQALAVNIRAYEGLLKSLDFTRGEITIPKEADEEPLKSAAGKTVVMYEAVNLITQTNTWKGIHQRTPDSPPPPKWFVGILQSVDSVFSAQRDILWYPPTAAGKDDWAGPGLLTKAIAESGSRTATAMTLMPELAELTRLAEDKAQNDAFQAKLLAFAKARGAEIKDQNIQKAVALDRIYLKYPVFEYAKFYFITLFLVAAVSWLKPNARRFHTVVKWAATIGFVGIAAGITERVLITGWGPVTSIDDTIPYIALLGGTFALLMTRVMKSVLPVGIAIALAAGLLFMFSSRELGNARDTMPALEAVLRSNYWLWTHVTSINLGYAVVLLSALFSMVYIIARVFDLMRTDTKLCRDLTRCSYGILCFGLFFSVVGTILGGIWGNDSWGRFWGWDPKENGAFLICVWCLFIMHMRLGGWVKEFGFHIWSAMGAIPVIFSWWHVNLLQVGLHSYGFTDGLSTKLYIAYAIVSAIVLMGVIVRILEGVARKQVAAQAAAAKDAPVQGTADAV